MVEKFVQEPEFGRRDQF